MNMNIETVYKIIRYNPYYPSDEKKLEEVFWDTMKRSNESDVKVIH